MPVPCEPRAQARSESALLDAANETGRGVGSWLPEGRSVKGGLRGATEGDRSVVAVHVSANPRGRVVGRLVEFPRRVVTAVGTRCGTCGLRGQTRARPGPEAITTMVETCLFGCGLINVLWLVERNKQVKRVRKHGERQISRRARPGPVPFYTCLLAP